MAITAPSVATGNSISVDKTSPIVDVNIRPIGLKKIIYTIQAVNSIEMVIFDITRKASCDPLLADILRMIVFDPIRMKVASNEATDRDIKYSPKESG